MLITINKNKYKIHIISITIFILLNLIFIAFIYATSPKADDIKHNKLLIEGILFVDGGGAPRYQGFVKIGESSVNLSTDLFGSGSGPAGLRAQKNNDQYVYAENISIPTLFDNRTIVTKIRNKQNAVIYERSLDQIINTWISVSINTCAIISFIVANCVFILLQHKQQRRED